MTTISSLLPLTTITNTDQILVLAEDQQVNPPITKNVTLTTLFAQAMNGVIGAQGVHGAQGIQGPSGPNIGIQGTQGFQGSLGFQGSMGHQGVVGPQGNSGIQGVRGSQGTQGKQGIQGMTGFGTPGTQGPQGVQGVSGTSTIRLLGYTSIISFGGVGDGTTDNTTALTNALASLTGTGGVIYFPPGKYYFSSAISYTFPTTDPWSVKIAGAGADVSILQWGATNGLTFNASNPHHTVHVEDLTFCTTAANQGTAITINQSHQLGAIEQNDVVRCTFRADSFITDGYSSGPYWTNGIVISGLSNVNVEGCVFFGYTTNGEDGYGNGISLVGVPSGTNKYGIVYNISSCGFYFLGIGINYGTYIQGLQITLCNFTGGVTAIYAPASETGLDQLSISNSQFNTYGNTIWLKTAIGQVSIMNNLIYVPVNQSGLFAESEAGVIAIGNFFVNIGAQHTGQNAIVLGPGSAPSMITGNAFLYMGTAITLLSGCQNVNIQSNAYYGNTHNVTNNGSNNTIGGGSI